MADSEKPQQQTPKKETIAALPRTVLKPAPKKVKRDEAPQTQAEDVEDEIIDSSEAHDTPATQPAAKRTKKQPVKTGKHFAEEDSCCYNWKQIQVGRKYKAMSVGTESRSRTGLVLVPLDDF